MKILSPKLPERILKQLAKRPMMVLGAATLSLKVGKDAVHLKAGKIDGSEFKKRTGGHVGSVGLGTAAGYAGMALGVFLSPVPVLGGLLGGFAGGALGEVLGEKLGRGAVELAGGARKKSAPAGEVPEAAPEDATPPEPGMEPPPRRRL
jgi:phage tail tape-measure protein